nr:TetR/AcrR family transcriptional regulator [Streptomyces sp. SID5785]
MAAAAALFGEHGFASTTVRDIAAEAGVSVGTVMAVGDKAAILVELFDRRIAALHSARAGRPPRPTSGARPADDVLALFAPFVEAFTADAELARHYAAALVSGRHRAGVFDELAGVLRREIADVLTGHGFPPARAERAATAVHLAYLGTLFLGAGSGTAELGGPAADLATAVELVLESGGQPERKPS